MNSLKNITYRIGVPALLLLAVSCSHKDSTETPEIPSTKKERNYIKEGNKLYNEQRYAESEVSYKKALQENPDNKVAQFNLASSFIKQRGEDQKNQGDSLMAQASRMLAELSQTQDVKVSQASFYDQGNLVYKSESYEQAVEMYKNALRRDPSDNQARQNLRLAQLKLKEQQKNQDKDKDKKQDQNSGGQQDKKDQQPPQQQKGGLSDSNAQQILKAMEDKENATRRKLEKMQQGQPARGAKSQPEKPW